MSPIALILALLIASCQYLPAAAIRFNYYNGSIGSYNLTKSNRYRQLPYYRVGVFAADTWQAAASRRDMIPYVNVQLEITGFPHENFEVYVYHYEKLESTFWIYPGQHPCQDGGQSSGVYIMSNMSAYAVAMKAGKPSTEIYPDGTTKTFMRVDGRMDLATTGLYIITMNACRYVWKDARGTTYTTQPDNSVLAWRTLDTTGWENIRVNGYIDVRNPYGWVPGQSYGAIPFYALAFLITLLVTIVWVVSIFFIGMTKVLTYHWMILAMLVFSLTAYMFMLIYLGVLNEQNKNDLALFGFAQVVLIIRSTVTRFVVFLLASGLEITKRDVSVRTKALTFVGAALYFLVNIIMLMISEFSGNDSNADHARIMQAEGMGARQGFQIAWFFFEVIVAVLIFVALHRSIKETVKANDLNRVKMFQRMAVLLSIYAICAFIWFFYSTFSPSGMGTLSEGNWQSWWFGPAAWEIGYLEVVIGCVGIWFPRRETTTYMQLGSNVHDNANYDNIGAGRPGAPPQSRPVDVYAGPPAPGQHAPGGSPPLNGSSSASLQQQNSGTASRSGAYSRGSAIQETGRGDEEMRPQQRTAAATVPPRNGPQPPQPSNGIHDDDGGAFDA